MLTRVQAEPLRAKAMKLLGTADTLRVDMTGANALSPSFADEFFGAMSAQMGISNFRARVRVVCEKPSWRKLISAVLAHRAARSKASLG